MEVIKQIMKFQSDRGLDTKEFNSFNENLNIVEELLEATGLDTPKENRLRLGNRWSELIGSCQQNKISLCVPKQTDDDIADAYCDVIVFAIGALMKLGYDPEIALGETAKEINSRVGEMVNGKFEKDLSPEAQANWYKADYSKALMSY